MAPRPSGASLVVGVEQQPRRARMAGRVRQSLGDAEGLDRRNAQQLQILVCFVSVQLHEVETHQRGDVAGVVARGVAENTDKRRRLLAALSYAHRDLGRALGLDEARGGGYEDEADEVRAEAGGGGRAGSPAEAAVLDPGHAGRSPATASAT